MTITSQNETPVVFGAGGEQLVGILTRPEGEGNGVAVITLWGTGPFPVFLRNGVGVSVARDLAAVGFDVLRFDYRGAGDSGGAMREANLDEPWVDDVLGAVRLLEGRGHRNIVLVSVCFGARSALAAMGQIAGLAGILMISPPVGQSNHTQTILEQDLRWYLKRGLSPMRLRGLLQGTRAKRRRRLLAARLRQVVRPPTRRTGVKRSGAELSPQFFEPLRALVEAGVPTKILYGRRDDFFPAFERALNGPLGPLIDQAEHATVQIMDGHASNVASLEAQQNMRALVAEWAASLLPAQSADEIEPSASSALEEEGVTPGAQ